ncbi:MAG: bifunctional shikimate kinase/3-dehydroquinate synthase [Solirubrobacteraceae bacterium]
MAALGPRSLVFVGFMGAGKTTAARVVAQELGVEALDTDELVERELGMPIARFFDEHGEPAFRDVEERVVVELLEGREAPPVVALGGGALESAPVRAALARHVVVALEVVPGDAWARVRQAADRPLARDRGAFEALHTRRTPLYERAADAILPPADPGVAGRALPTLVLLRDRAPEGTRMLWARSTSGEYPVLLGRGLLRSGTWPLEGRRFVLTDERVAELHLDALGETAATIAIAPGEEAKSLATAETVWRALAREGMTPSDHLVGLGGGVVGDLAGFCAATYRRGVPVVHVPTTLVAQVDSAYGGKTGVDLPEGKNYVGAYHQPAAVIVDPETLETLPPEELAAGWAEVVKTALIAGGALWERVREGRLDDEAILACARVKLAVVAEDERDMGHRQVLNLGHTVAHAIETATGYARYRHGEAVALGLLAALRLSGQDGLRAEVSQLLATRGLPTALDGVDPDEVVALTARDKKRRGEAPTPFVLLDAPGEVHPGRTVDDAQLRAAVAELAVR